MVAWHRSNVTACQAHAISTMIGFTKAQKIGNALEDFESIQRQ